MDDPSRMAAVAPEQDLPSRQRRAFAVARDAAAKVLKRRFRLLALVRDAYAKLGRHEHALTRVQDDLRLLLRLARAWATRQYRNVPWRSVLYAVAAIIYFVNPVDVIPDVLVGIGFVDDAAVVAAVVRAIRKDLEAFRDWESPES